MYTIGNIIFGIPIDDELYSKIESELGEEWEEEFINTEGYLSWYSGAGLRPCAIGIELDSIDECEDVNLTNIVNRFQDWTFSVKFKVPEKLKKFVEGIKPDFWIVWSTS